MFVKSAESKILSNMEEAIKSIVEIEGDVSKREEQLKEEIAKVFGDDVQLKSEDLYVKEDGGYRIERTYQHTADNKDVTYVAYVQKLTPTGFVKCWQTYFSKVAIGTITYNDQREYVGIIHPETLEPFIIGVYKENGREVLGVSSIVKGQITDVFPVIENDLAAIYDALDSFVEMGVLTTKEAQLIKNKANSFTGKTYFNDLVLQLKKCALFSNGEFVLLNMDENESFYFTVMDANGHETPFAQLTQEELRTVMTKVNAHYEQTGETLYPFSSVARRINCVVEDNMPIQYVNVTDTLKNACYFDEDFHEIDGGNISFRVSNSKGTYYSFSAVEDLFPSELEQISKWKYPAFRVLMDERVVMIGNLGSGVSKVKQNLYSCIELFV